MNLENFFDDIGRSGDKGGHAHDRGISKAAEKGLDGDPGLDAESGCYRHRRGREPPDAKKLAERINTDTVAAGKPNPKYEAYLEDGNDGRGIEADI